MAEFTNNHEVLVSGQTPFPPVQPSQRLFNDSVFNNNDEFKPAYSSTGVTITQGQRYWRQVVVPIHVDTWQSVDNFKSWVVDRK